jgi:hypothetical protein
MNNNFNLKKFLAEGRLLKEDTQNDVNVYKQLLDKVPNEKYFQVLKDEEEDNAKYGISNVDPGDYYDYLYEPLFDNELKGKPGIGYNDFYELQEKEREENNDEVGPLERLIINKAGAIIKDYNQTSNLKEGTQNKNILIINHGSDELGNMHGITASSEEDFINQFQSMYNGGPEGFINDVVYLEIPTQGQLDKIVTMSDKWTDDDERETAYLESLYKKAVSWDEIKNIF